MNKRVNACQNSFDIILLIAVLHHIPGDELTNIIKDLKRILKYPSGKIIVLEPCLFEDNLLNNYFMKLFDRGKYIRRKDEYLNLFKRHNLKIEYSEKISKIAFKEILFSVSQM